jgi:hypothetical protein
MAGAQGVNKSGRILPVAIRPLRRRLVIRTMAAAVAALLAGSASPAVDIHEFYEQQLAAGKIDFQAHQLPRAADELRIAAFGFLDRPPLLAEALVRLAVAQSALGLKGEVSVTLERFVEVEQHFAPYRTISIEPQT